MAYTGTSIVDFLNSTGQASDYSSRATLAKKYGISNYTGSADQNTQLLNILNQPSNTGSTGNTSGNTGNKATTSTYGKTETSSMDTLGKSELQTAETGTQGYVNPTFLSNLINNSPDLIAFYTNALAYGGYTVGDVVNDIKRREMVSQGNTQVADLAIIDPNKDRTTYYSSDPAGIKAQSSAVSLIPTGKIQGLTDTGAMNYGTNAPAGLFDTPSPLLDPTSQEFKDAVANTKSAYYDVLNQQLSASTEQQKAVADYAADKFKTDLERQYGIVLSDDATKAYNQIQNLETTYGQRGLENSGMQNEAVDQSLRQTRLTDQRQRQQELSDEEYKQASTLMASGTPAQIQQTIAEDQAKGLPQSEWRATKWGLIPDPSVAAQFSISALQQKFPDYTPKQIQALHDSVLDENGNYRSTLYANYYSQLNTNQQNEKTAAEGKVTAMATNAADKAMTAQTGDPSNPLTVQGGTGTTAGTPNVTPPTSSTSNNNQISDAQTKAIQDSINKIQSGINNVAASQGVTLSQNSNGSYTSTPVTTPKTTTPAPAPVQTPAAPAKSTYSGSSIVDYLGSTGAANDYASRAALAAKQGITGYTGTAAQNTQLLTKLRGY